jgi:ADP-ribose pyrophosphatase YjhB (NUDIX family)
MSYRPLIWRTSSYSGSGGTCVAVARAADGRVLVRNSNHPHAGTLAVTPGQLGAWMTTMRTGLENATTA